jgi:hypothetical protein
MERTMRTTAIPDLVALAMQASDDKIEWATRILKGKSYAQPHPPKPPVEPFKTLEAVAKEVGIGRITLWRYNIPGHNHAGRVRYRTCEVLEYLESPKLQIVVQLLRANGWRRPTKAEIDAAVGTGESAGSGR